MGFFSDLKEDLSQAVNELLPDETLARERRLKGMAENTALEKAEAEVSPLERELMDAFGAQEEQIEETVSPVYRNEETSDVMEWGKDTEEAIEIEKKIDAGKTINTEQIISTKKTVSTDDILSIGIELETDKSKLVDRIKGMKEMLPEDGQENGISVIAPGVIVKGDVFSSGPVNVFGTIDGNIETTEALLVTGNINGYVKASELLAQRAVVKGEVICDGAVQIGENSVIIGNITAKNALIVGAVNGDIDVRGPVVLDSSAIVMGNIKSQSVEINKGAVVEGMCSQCYADVSPFSFFDEYKTE